MRNRGWDENTRRVATQWSWGSPLLRQCAWWLPSCVVHRYALTGRIPEQNPSDQW